MKGWRALVVRFDQEKTVLGDTCSRLAYTKQGVASSNTNICKGKSRFSDPDGSSLAWPGPSPARGQILEILGPGNPEIWNPTNLKNDNSKNPNPFCPKCRQGLDWPEKHLPGPIWGHPRPFSPWTEKIRKMRKHIVYFPWWANGPYSPA